MKRSRTSVLSRTVLAACVAALFLAAAGCARHEPGTYTTREEAVQALNALIGTGDQVKCEEIFGPGSLDLFRSGDDADDKVAGQRVKAMIAEKVEFDEIDPDTSVALFGNKAWPWPIPLVRHDNRWRFDTAKGREELTNRRVGFYELSTLGTLHEYVDAQREYASTGRDGNPPAFAKVIKSSDGKHDGLFWPPVEGEPESPLGDLLAQASFESRQAGDPYHGYRYRILTGQGKNAPGGEKSYLDAKGLMTKGFAAIAWPAKYGNSGVMTFIINNRGIAYQKDLGADTASAADAIQAFDPDSTWQTTGDTIASVEAVDDQEQQASAPGTTTATTATR